ncbi:serine-rich adhesin for platelets [Octopus sinensis]|uniref:Serine-rich adhesin for platelets n=1 Tax=Octopus sinensis TaxID=2607531 RepID=A0A7E6EXY6_9MOLL|nr:serine-rich adhesin for platelets [Octopus sinensis]
MLGDNESLPIDNDNYLENWKEKRRTKKKDLPVTLTEEEKEEVKKAKTMLTERGGGNVRGAGKEEAVLRTGGGAMKDSRRWTVADESGIQGLGGKLGLEKEADASKESELERVFRRRGSGLKDVKSMLQQQEQEKHNEVLQRQQRSRSMISSLKYHDNDKKIEDDKGKADRGCGGGGGGGDDDGGNQGQHGGDDKKDEKNKDQDTLHDPLHCRPGHHEGDNHDINKDNSNKNNVTSPSPRSRSSTGECLKQVPQTRSGTKEEEKERIGKIDKEKERVGRIDKEKEEKEDIPEVGKRKDSYDDSRSKARRESNDDGVSNRKEKSQKGEGKSERRDKGEKEGKEKVKEVKQEGRGVGEDKTNRLSGLSEPCAAEDNPKTSASCTDSNAPLVAATAAAGSVDEKLTQPSQTAAATTTTTTTGTATTTTTVKALTSTASTEAEADRPVVRRSTRLTTTTSKASAAAVAAEVSSKFKRPQSSFSPSSTSSSSAVSGSSPVFQPLKRPLSLAQASHPLPASPSKLSAKTTTTTTTTATTSITATNPTSTSTSDSSSSAVSPLSSLLSSSSSSSSLTRPLRVTAPTSGLPPLALKPHLGLTNSELQTDQNTAPAPEPNKSQEVASTIPEISGEVVTKVNSSKNNNEIPQQCLESALTNCESDSKETKSSIEPPSDSGLDTGIEPLVSPNSDLDQTDFSQSNDHNEEKDTVSEILTLSQKKVDFNLELSKSSSDIYGIMKQVPNEKAMSESDLSAIKVTRTLTNETARHKLLLRRKSSLARRQRPSRARKRTDSESDSDTSRPNTGDGIQDQPLSFSSELKNFHENEKIDTDSSLEKVPENITDYLPKVSGKHGDPGLQLKREKNLENEAVFSTQSAIRLRNLYNNDSDQKTEPNYVKEASPQTEKSLSSKRIGEIPEPLQLSPEDLSPPPLLSSPPPSSPEPFSSPPPVPESVEPQVPFRRFRPPHLRKGANKNNTDNVLEESVDKNWQNSLNELNTRISRKGPSNGNLTESFKGPRILRTKSSIERQIYKNLVEPETLNEKELSKTEDGSSVNDKSEDLLIEDYKKRKSISESNYSFDVKSVLRKVPENAKEKSPRDDSLAPKEPLFKNLESRRSTSFVHLEKKSDTKVQKDPPWLKDFSGKKVGRIFSKFDCVKSPTEKESDKEQTPKIWETYQTPKTNINGAEISKTRPSSLFTSSSTPLKDTNKTPVLSENKKPVINKEGKKLSSSSSLSSSSLQKHKTESKPNESWSTPTTYRRKSQESDKISQQRKSVSSTQNLSFSVSSISEAVPDWKKKLAEKNKTKRESFSKIKNFNSYKKYFTLNVSKIKNHKWTNRNYTIPTVKSQTRQQQQQKQSLSSILSPSRTTAIAAVATATTSTTTTATTTAAAIVTATTTATIIGTVAASTAIAEITTSPNKDSFEKCGIDINNSNNDIYYNNNNNSYSNNNNNSSSSQTNGYNINNSNYYHNNYYESYPNQNEYNNVNNSSNYSNEYLHWELQQNNMYNPNDNFYPNMGPYPTPSVSMPNVTDESYQSWYQGQPQQNYYNGYYQSYPMYNAQQGCPTDVSYSMPHIAHSASFDGQIYDQPRYDPNYPPLTSQSFDSFVYPDEKTVDSPRTPKISPKPSPKSSPKPTPKLSPSTKSANNLECHSDDNGSASPVRNSARFVKVLPSTLGIDSPISKPKLRGRKQPVSTPDTSPQKPSCPMYSLSNAESQHDLPSAVKAKQSNKSLYVRVLPAPILSEKKLSPKKIKEFTDLSPQSSPVNHIPKTSNLNKKNSHHSSPEMKYFSKKFFSKKTENISSDSDLTPEHKEKRPKSKRYRLKFPASPKFSPFKNKKSKSVSSKSKSSSENSPVQSDGVTDDSNEVDEDDTKEKATMQQVKGPYYQILRSPLKNKSIRPNLERSYTVPVMDTNDEDFLNRLDINDNSSDSEVSTEKVNRSFVRTRRVDDISQNKTEDASTVQPAWRQKLANKNKSSQSIEQSDKKVSEKPEWIRKAEERRARVSQSSLLKN